MKSSRLTTVRLEESADIMRLREVTMALTDVLKFGSFEKTRTVTAVVELGRNAIEHGNKGRARFSLTEIKGRPALGISVLDQGAGIPEGQLSGDLVVAAGAPGLGLGLRGVKRIADRFEVQTGSEGTRVDAVFAGPAPSDDTETLVSQATTAIAALNASDPAGALTEQNRELMDTIAARDLLMTELHHRTGNNLALIVALIRMSRRQAKLDETRGALQDLENRVAALSKAHELMQRAAVAGTVPAKDLLRDVARNAENAFNAEELRVRIEVECEPLTLDGKIAVDIALIVGELITNAYKHAFRGRDEGVISVGLAETPEGDLTLRISDNGVGLEDGADRPERSNSLGWNLIRTLTFQNNGTLEVIGQDGLTVEIGFTPDR